MSFHKNSIVWRISSLGFMSFLGFFLRKNLENTYESNALDTSGAVQHLWPHWQPHFLHRQLCLRWNKSNNREMAIGPFRWNGDAKAYCKQLCSISSARWGLDQQCHRRNPRKLSSFENDRQTPHFEFKKT